VSVTVPVGVVLPVQVPVQVTVPDTVRIWLELMLVGEGITLTLAVSPVTVTVVELLVVVAYVVSPL
jgi:hypothetical protein